MAEKPEQYLPLKPLILNILLVLGEQAHHGYSLMRLLKEDPRFTTPVHTGPLYRALKHLLETGLVTERDKPPAGVLRLAHFAEVAGIYCLHDLVGAMKLLDLHHWSHDTITQRYHYRQPGLFVLPVRIYRAAETFEIPDAPAYAGCKTWVELEKELSTENATPVLSDDEFRRLLLTLDDLLNPTAFA